MVQEENKIKCVAQTEMSIISTKCHQCGVLCKGRSRCRYCQSKVYCSEECKSADWEIHEMFCKEIQEAAEGGEMGRRLSKREMDKKGEVMATEDFQESNREELSSLQLRLGLK